MSRLQDLITLAREDSSDKRRELLREITDCFFARAPEAAEIPLYDDVLSRLTAEMEAGVRAELGLRFADSAMAPRGLIRKLANDEELEVAAPVLSRSPVLTDDDLLEVVRSKSQGHLQAVSVRQTVSEAVSEVIVERGDDTTLGVLLENDGARLSRNASEVAVDRAKRNPALHEAVVNRRQLPPDLLNDMYFVVEARLKQRILEENARIDPKKLEAALRAQRIQKAVEAGALPVDYAEAEARVIAFERQGRLDPQTLIRLLRESGSAFTIAIARMTELDFATADRVLKSKELDAVAVVCKAADLERAIFLTIAVVLLGQTADAMTKAREYGDLYDALPRETAQRTLRFWKLRRQTERAA
jgi:uncharacterized protein (DUF2336 family)